MTSNPFKPTAGKNPPILIGRDYVINEFVEGIENGPGAPGRLMRITGMRGMGKTVVLNEIARQAQNMGWAVIEETASEGFCDRILAAALPERRVERLSAAPSVLGVSLGSVEIETAAMDLREALRSAIKKNGKGLVITLDETQDASLSEVRALAVAVQHEIREDANIAFVFAGLPSMIESVLNGKTLTFLRRAIPIELRIVGNVDVAFAFADTMKASGMEIDKKVAEQLADAACGYPFMIQLVGYHAWQLAHRENNNVVDSVVAQRGIALARERFDMTVIEPALQRLPKRLIEYLLAMTEDKGRPSDTSEVAKRMESTTQKTSSYRARLIRENVIESLSWGKVSFSMPYMAEYLNKHRENLRDEAMF